MRLRLEYGRSGLEAELPDDNLVGVLTLNPAPPVPDPRAAVEEALAHPIGALPLEELARRRRDACIVVCDVTRPVPNSVLLPPMLESLERAGIPRERITILVATGTHRPNEGAELEAMLGSEVASSYRVVNHVCTDRASHVDLGISCQITDDSGIRGLSSVVRGLRAIRGPQTGSGPEYLNTRTPEHPPDSGPSTINHQPSTPSVGLPVLLDRTYCDADLKLTVGLIEPHFMAGYSGGRKLIMPGLAALETVQAWHSPRFLEHPNASMGVVDGNPVHEEALRIARMVPPDLILDVTLDERNRITGVFAGEMEAAWRTGVAAAERAAHAPVPEPVDVVVTTCAGYPLDATFYQAVKGMVGALPILRPGGSIIIAASCSEGIGGQDFTRTLLETEDLCRFREDIQRSDWRFIPDQWEVEELAKAVSRADVYCVCDGIAPETLARCFVTPVETVEQGVHAALAKLGAHATIAAIPKGPYVIPYVEPGL